MAPKVAPSSNSSSRISCLTISTTLRGPEDRSRFTLRIIGSSGAPGSFMNGDLRTSGERLRARPPKPPARNFEPPSQSRQKSPDPHRDRLSVLYGPPRRPSAAHNSRPMRSTNKSKLSAGALGSQFSVDRELLRRVGINRRKRSRLVELHGNGSSRGEIKTYRSRRSPIRFALFSIHPEFADIAP
jgi:hypothetical protein